MNDVIQRGAQRCWARHRQAGLGSPREGLGSFLTPTNDTDAFTQEDTFQSLESLKKEKKKKDKAAGIPGTPLTSGRPVAHQG